jgi:hypothetical protein
LWEACFTEWWYLQNSWLPLLGNLKGIFEKFATWTCLFNVPFSWVKVTLFFLFHPSPPLWIWCVVYSSLKLKNGTCKFHGYSCIHVFSQLGGTGLTIIGYSIATLENCRDFEKGSKILHDKLARHWYGHWSQVFGVVEILASINVAPWPCYRGWN